MKKTIIVLAVALFSGSCVMAQVDPASKGTPSTPMTQTQSSKYMYYPQSNVYYNESTKTYSYFNSATNSWTTNMQLPTTFKLNKTDQAEISYSGADIWKENPDHQKKYKQPVKPVEKAQGNR